MCRCSSENAGARLITRNVPTTPVTIAVLQAPLAASRAQNVDLVASLAEDALDRGATIVLPPELFEGPYFPQTEDPSWFAEARPLANNPTLARFVELSARTKSVIPISFFERAGQAYYNSVAIIDSGTVLGCYRKSHIPDGPGYEEKFYFRPGDTGFQVWHTSAGTIGVGICWDQWFPEAARAMTLMGADLLLYPTCIGSEPHEPSADTQLPWRRAMTGHAVCNATVVAAANRVGQEGDMRFYGSSFIVDQRGDELAALDREQTSIAMATVDLAALQEYRANWGFFRDRRPELYDVLATADGARPVRD